VTRYGYSPVLLEAFVELERFTGACYRAANWIEVGTTKGRGKIEKTTSVSSPSKAFWSIPSKKTSAPSATDELTRGSPNIYRKIAKNDCLGGLCVLCASSFLFLI